MIKEDIEARDAGVAPPSTRGIDKTLSEEDLMFNKILVPLDGSPLAETVLPHVATLAGVFASQIFLLKVLESGSNGQQSPSLDPLDWQIIKAEAQNYLDNIATTLHSEGFDVQVSIMEGNAAESVLEFSEEQQVDLIALSSHGQSGISGWNVSSVVQKIILRSHTSVLIVRAYQPFPGKIGELRYRKIFVPLDGSRRAESVMPVVTSLARAQEAEMIIGHVVHRPEMPRRTPPNQEDMELAERITERNRMEASRYLDELISRLDVSIEVRLIVSEQVIPALHELVEREEIDLVLLTAHGYSGGTKWPYGSKVVSFIAYGTTPLLIFQDLPRDRIEASLVEEIAKESGSR
jgi:nucleotide-binding universal stress UspA family protein